MIFSFFQSQSRFRKSVQSASRFQESRWSFISFKLFLQLLNWLQMLHNNACYLLLILSMSGVLSFLSGDWWPFTQNSSKFSKILFFLLLDLFGNVDTNPLVEFAVFTYPFFSLSEVLRYGVLTKSLLGDLCFCLQLKLLYLSDCGCGSLKRSLAMNFI